MDVVGEATALPITVSSQDDSFQYSNKHGKTGYAVIICNMEFSDPRYGDRDCAQKDVTDLEGQLQKIGFIVKKFCNKTAHEMKQIIKSASSYDHTDSDCFLCVLSSHGKWSYEKNEDKLTDEIIGKDGKAVRIRTLLDAFQPSKCQSLANKPKIFWLQCCRGNYYTNNTVIKKGPDGEVLEAENQEFVGSEVQHLGHNPAHPESFQIPYHIPIRKDYLIHCATTPGNMSFKHGSGGTPFLQSWHKVLKENTSSTDLLSMSTMVNAEVSTYSSNAPSSEKLGAHNRKQLPQVVSMLTKDFYFSEEKILAIAAGKLKLQ